MNRPWALSLNTRGVIVEYRERAVARYDEAKVLARTLDLLGL